MSDQTDTPETDAVMLTAAQVRRHIPEPGFPLVRYDYARRLERERDEARKLAEQWRELWRGRDSTSLVPSLRLPWETDSKETK